MAVNGANIYHGPLTKIEISDDGTTWTDLGAIGANNAEISFEPAKHELGDKQTIQLYGMGKIVVNAAESHTVNIALVKVNTQQYLRVTDFAGKTYTTVAMFLTYATKRGFGDEPHTLIIEGTKAVSDEDQFITIV